MIKLTVTNALVHSVTPVMQVSENFQKRELVINDSWSRDGQDHPNFVAIEFTGDKMPLLDALAPGMRINLEACINGREKNGRIFNSIRGLSVSFPQPQPQAAPQQPQPQYQQAPAPQQYQQPANYPPQQYSPQGYQQYPPQQYPPQGYAPQQPAGPTAANLPFPS